MRPTVRAAALLSAVAIAATGGACGIRPASGAKATESPSATGSPAPASAATPNNEQKKTGSQIAADAQAALITAGSTHTVGTGTSGGKPISLDLKVQGADTAGSFEQGGVPAQIIVVGQAGYLRGDERLYSQFADSEIVAQLIGKRWLKLPAGQAAGFGFTMTSLAASIGPKAGVTAKAVGTGELSGQRVVIVTWSDGSRLYVAATGKPYPLRRVQGGSSAATVTFADFGTDFHIAAPAGALDLSQVG